MPRRWPTILWRHLLFEQIRLVAVTTVIVGAVMAFAAAIKPLADGTLDPLDAPRFMLYAVVPMLAYTLPFAAGFGTTLAYHRLTQDNETLAAHASGLSHRSLVVPALASGLLLALTLAVLNEELIPRFLREMERMVTRDVARMVTRNVEQGRPVPFGESVIYADAAEALGPDAAAGAYEHILMQGVAFLELANRRDAESPLRVRAEVTTGRAMIWLYEGEEIVDEQTGEQREGTVAIIRLTDSVIRREGDQTLVRVRDQMEVGPIFIPGAKRHDPKFLTRRELATIEQRPEQMEFIRWRQRELAYALAEAESLLLIEEALADGGFVLFHDPLQNPVKVYASELRRAAERLRFIPAPARAGQSRPYVEVEVYRDGGRSGSFTRWRVEEAYLRPQLGSSRHTRKLDFDLELRVAHVVDAEGEQGQREALAFGGLRLPGGLVQELTDLPARSLIAAARQRMGADAASPQHALLAEKAEALEDRLAALRREVIGERHERLAMSLSAMVMVLAGAVIAMRLRGAAPLNVYLWSFFPALGAIITINGGEQLVQRYGVSGLPLLWGGLLALALYTFAAWRGLVRH